MDRALDRATIVLCGVWIAILLTSGVLEPEVWTLHLFQALIYVAVAALTVRGSKWAPGVGMDAEEAEEQVQSSAPGVRQQRRAPH